MMSLDHRKNIVCAFIAAIVAIVGGCSSNFYKADADKDVYKIIDSKWRDGFGQKANYIISDSNIASPNDIKISTFPVPPEKMTLTQAVAIATSNSRDYKRNKEALYSSALGLSTERHKYETQLFGTVSGEYQRNYTDVPKVINVTDSNGVVHQVTSGTVTTVNEQITLRSSLGVQQEFLLGNGIDITTNLAINWAKFLMGDPRTTLGSVLTTSVAVPLLGNGAGKQKLETRIQTERSVVYAIRDFNRYRQTFVVDTINAYYGVLQTRDAVTNAQNNYQRVLESKDRLQMEYQAGRRTRIDVDEAFQNVLSAESRVVNSQQSYDKTLDAFKLRLAIAIDANIELDQNELNALKEMGVEQPSFAVDEAIETALLRRLDLANSADKIDDKLRLAVLSEQGLGPQINLTGQSTFSSPTGNNDFQNLRLHEGDYSFGFDADLPLDRKSQRNDYRAALIDLEQQRRQYDGDVDNVKLQVRDAFRRLRQTSEQYRIQQNSLNLATQRVESNKLLLDAGRVTVRILLESQDALLTAQNDVTSALIDHLDAKLSFYRDVGILQVKPDGMWAQVDKNSGKPTNERDRENQHKDENL